MHEHPRCNIDVVAAGRHCEVHVCRDCGAVHLHIGPFSLRLRTDIYRSICNTLAISISHMDTAGGLAAEGLTPSPQLKHYILQDVITELRHILAATGEILRKNFVTQFNALD